MLIVPNMTKYAAIIVKSKPTLVDLTTTYDHYYQEVVINRFTLNPGTNWVKR